MIKDNDTPISWCLREANSEEALRYAGGVGVGRDLFIFENGRAFERMLIERAMRETRPIELPELLP